jgi:crotonobetaine/carnitine-CoA ligase
VRSHPGRPIVNEARIVDGDGRDLPPGEVGELWLRNPVTMSGYLNDPERTDAVFTDGWLRTGDHLRRDADDFFYFVDRADDVIRHKGENVASAEVETILDSHPAVLESAVLGVASELTDKEIVAFVQLREGETATEEALGGWCRGSLAPFKVPETFVFVEALPKTATNKVRKNELRVLLDRPRAGESR